MSEPDTNKVLIIGGLGFLGLNFAESLISNGKNSVVIADLSDCAHRLKLLANHNKITLETLKSAQNADWCEIFAARKPDLVVSLLGTSTPAFSPENMISEVNANLAEHIRILNALTKTGIKKFAYFSSGGTVYGPAPENKLLSEESPTQPINSYGITKLSIEHYVRVYSRETHLKHLIFRPSNPYGPYHHAPKQGLINILIRNALANKPTEIWGSLNTVRDYIYSEDLARIAVALLNTNKWNETYNIGSGKGTSISEIVDLIKMNQMTVAIKHASGRSADASRTVLDIRKTAATLGELNLTQLDIGIQKTINWARDSQKQSQERQ